jgi:hypothetical protein
MKRIFGILAGLVLAASAQAADFQAVSNGNFHATNTWGVTAIPGASDNVDLNGKAITLTNSLTLASLVDVATGGSLDLGAGVAFICRAVTNAPLTTSAEGVSVDCDYTLTMYAYGFTINSGGVVAIQGTWSNSAAGSCFINSGTITDISGTVNNSGNEGIFNYYGTITDISGTVNVYENHQGILNDYGTITDISGTVNVHGGGGQGINNNAGTITDISGTVNILCVDGQGVVDNYGTITDISGMVLDTSGSGAITLGTVGGTVSIITGIVGRPSSVSTLTPGNVKSGVTILGVTGTLQTGGSGYGINGTGLLGASW